MSTTVQVPDLGVDSAEVIEILVQPGDSVDAEQGIVMVESDKASMEIPAGQSGVVEALHVKVGDAIGQGNDLVTLSGEAAASSDEENQPFQQPEADVAVKEAPASEEGSAPATGGAEEVVTIAIPDLGVDEATIIEQLVEPGSSVEAEQGLVMVESDKASMEIPAPQAGVLVKLLVKVGDVVHSNDNLAELKVVQSGAATPAPSQQPAQQPDSANVDKPASQAQPAASQQQVNQPSAGQPVDGKIAYAGPAVRKLARQLGVDLSQLNATGPNGRVLKEDIHTFVKTSLAAGPSGGAIAGGSLTSAPAGNIDFSQFGDIRIEDMSRLQQLTADNMAKTSSVVPQVTQFDNADITELEAFRSSMKEEAAKQDIRLTIVAFLVMASAKALRAIPQVNVTIDQHRIIHKEYCNIGIAVDTPAGLMVPVITDADKKGLYQLANEIGELAQKARKKSLKPKEMQGGCFTISSLGAGGGTNFTPLVNHPEAAILGVSKSSIQPVWNGKEFMPRLICPLALSYDHRAINGADGARFVKLIAQWLEDPRKMLL